MEPAKPSDICLLEAHRYLGKSHDLRLLLPNTYGIRSYRTCPPARRFSAKPSFNRYAYLMTDTHYLISIHQLHLKLRPKSTVISTSRIPTPDPSRSEGSTIVLRGHIFAVGCYHGNLP